MYVCGHMRGRREVKGEEKKSGEEEEREKWLSCDEIICPGRSANKRTPATGHPLPLKIGRSA